METPRYLQVLWSYKWLLLFGALVAGAAAFFAGFTIQNGEVISRAEKTFSATTTMLVTSTNARLYQAEVPGVPLQEGISEPQLNDLTQTALLYAYLIASDATEASVAAVIGPLDEETESITGLRRTTQPTGDERFPGRYDLPVLEAIGTAPTEARAELISRTAADAFLASLVAQQDAQGIDPALRVYVSVLSANKAVEGDGSNPAIPIVVTFFGTFLAFVVLAFVIAGIRSGFAKRRADKAERTDEQPREQREAQIPEHAIHDDAGIDELDDFARSDELVTAGPMSRTRRSFTVPRMDDDHLAPPRREP